MSVADLAPIRSDVDDALADLRAFGCCRVAGLLPPALLDRVAAAVSRLAAADRDGPDPYAYGRTNQRVWSLIHRDDVFLELAEHAPALGIMRSMLGPDPLLSNMSANIVGPGGAGMVAHWDQDWAERPWPHALVAHAIWMLDDFTEANGPTLVWPGSHLLAGPPQGEGRPATGPAGTCLMVDGRTWHAVAPNRSPSSRRGVLAYYCRPYIRQ
ncbi:MAG TPA: phytanoyl-CoA dioxygenase family protein, partial [Acidimicrobiales bacterium]